MQWIQNLLGGDNRSFQLAILVGVVAVVLLVLVVLYRLFLRQRLRLPKSARARQSRLALVDAHSLDGQRQLVLIRRDNVEHLVMIGGPNDVLLESHIVRSTAASLPIKDREAPAAKAAAPAVQQAARSLPASGPAEAALSTEKALAAIPPIKRAAEAQPRPLRPDPVVNQAAAVKTEPVAKPAPTVVQPALAQRPQPVNNLPPPLEKPAPAKPALDRPFVSPAPRAAPAAEPPPAAVAAKPAPAPAPREDDIETLEAEMARLLGRAP
jgi:flagellar protein FliO/FliZ